jgi:PHD/YefM family antitoxin component YafN of YafNO toxin-antitoxin module
VKALSVQVLTSKEARKMWRQVLDNAGRGSDVVVERYGKPEVAVIAYRDFLAIRDELAELRTARQAAEIYDAWKDTPDRRVPYEDFRAELVAKGLLDE